MKSIWTFQSQANWTVGIDLTRDGKFMGTHMMNLNLDPNGTNLRQEIFLTIQEAMTYVGYPWEILGIPDFARPYL